MKQIFKFFRVLTFAFLFGSIFVQAQYCIPTYSNGCTYGDGLTLFQLNTINQAISCSGSPSYYHDYTSLSTSLTIGTPYTITVQAGYSSTYVTFWIDYNHNNTFDVASETIGQVICSSSGTNYTITFTIPVTAITGATRLRAMTEWIGYPSGPCSTTESYGNCSDFTVNITSPGYCTPTYTTGCTFGDGLTLFNLNTINQPVACNGVPNAWYHDWTTTSTTLMLNTNYTLTVQAGYSSTYVSVWIDYNNDFTFAATERVVTDLICASSGTNYTATINVPLGTTLGNHRLRFRTSWASTSADPCATYSYGNAGDFTVNLIAYAPPTPPTCVTLAATLITSNSAILNGTVNANNALTTVTFNYGLTAAYGTTVPAVPATISGSTVTPVMANITGLLPNTLYHYQVCGVNSAGNSCGTDMTFTTSAIPPSVTTSAATGVTNVLATLNGIVNANNSSTTVSFEYGLTTAYGTTVPGVPATVNGSLNTNVSANISGLTVNTTYHFRVKGVNTAGTSNGNDLTFFTVCNASGPAGPITGPGQVCQGGSGYVYTVAPITNASGYNWTVPVGGTIVAGANTNSITVNFGLLSYSGNLFVYGLGCAGNGAPSNMLVIVNPNATPTISGPASVCVTSTGNVYTTQPGMTNYNWSVTGGTITAGGTPTSNTAMITWNAAGSQTVSVNYNNAAGCPALTPTVYNVTVNPLPLPVISGPATACTSIPGNVYSTQAVMTSYSWVVSAGGQITSGAGTNSINVIWNATGAQQVTVSFANANGCTSNAAAYAVTVKQGPTPTISGSNLLCANSGYYYYITEAGMTGYTWTVSAGGTISGGQGTNALQVNWNTAGNQSVTVNYINANGCGALAPVVYPVTVTTVPGPAGTISGSSTVCAGATGVAYSIVPIPDAHVYVWTLPPGVTIITGLYTNAITVDFAANASSGNISVTGNNICGNGTPSPNFPVAINPYPDAAGTITGQASVCAGTSGVIYSVAPIANATGYVWTVPAGATIMGGSNTSSITVDFGAGASSGNVTVYGTNNCGNGNVSPNFAVMVYAMPPAPVITLAGDTLTSSAPAGNQWYMDGTLLPGATGQFYIATLTGHYTDVVTLNNCSSVPSNDIYFVKTGIQPLQATGISIYPVPNEGQFILEISSGKTQIFTVSLINNIGITIYKVNELVVHGTVKSTIDLRPIPEGFYTIVLQNNDNHVVKKIIINK